MKHNILSYALCLLLTMPCLMHAEEIEIQLMEVIQMGMIGGDHPLGDPSQQGNTPTRPTDFRATINGNALAITKQNSAIPSAQALVVKVANGSIVTNSSFTTSLSDQMPSAGVYSLRIQTAGGDLVGQFIVQ